MKSLLMIFCALALLSGATAILLEFKCDWRNYEYFCLVGNACIKGNRESISDSLIHFDPSIHSLKMKENNRKIADCDWILKIRNQNDIKWHFILEYPEMKSYEKDFSIALSIGASQVFNCSIEKNEIYDKFRGFGKWDTIDDVPFCHYTVHKKGITQNFKLEDYMMQYLNSSTSFSGEGIQLEFKDSRGTVKTLKYDSEYDKATMLQEITMTKGCDDSLVIPIFGDISTGLVFQTEHLVVGKNAPIDCKAKRGVRIFIQGSSEEDEIVEVRSVFCAGNIWAYEKKDKKHKKKVKYLPQTQFRFACTRDYCAYCGAIMDEGCPMCKKHTTNSTNCMPKCPNDLWHFGNSVVQSNLTCKPHPENNENGVWMAISNGVDVPVEMASCYVGPYPLPKAKITTSSSLIASWWIAMMATFIII